MIFLGNLIYVQLSYLPGWQVGLADSFSQRGVDSQVTGVDTAEAPKQI